MSHFKLILFSFATVLFATPVNALIYFELSAGIGAGDSEIVDSTATVNSHEGFVLEADSNVRLGLNLAGLSFGGLYNMGQFNSSYTKKVTAVSVVEGESYQTSYDHQYIGAFLGLNLPNTSFRIWGEYYSSAKIIVHYAERSTDNIFEKHDEFSGKGYGTGIGYQVSDTIYTYLFYRSIEFDSLKVKTTGNTTALPSNTLSKLKLRQILVGVTFVASWL